MAIPSYEEIMLPFLRLTAKYETIESKDLRESLAKEFKLTEEEVLERTPSGTQILISNRIGWAMTYLKKAGLIENPSRGLYKITKEGKKYSLRESLTTKDLENIPAFKEFQNISNRKDNLEVKSNNESSHVSKQTPTEEIERQFETIKNQTINDILEKLSVCDPYHVQRIALEVVAKSLGYDINNADRGRKGGDGGIDGTVYKDPLKLDKIYIQVKRQKDKVSPESVRAFVAVVGKKEGVFITTSDFTAEAKKVVEGGGTKIALISGIEFATHMWEHDIGIQNEQTYVTKEIDEDYFEE